IIAAERAVAPGRSHLEHTVVEDEDRDIEGSAAEVVDREPAVLLLLEAISERGSCRLVEESKHLEPGETPRVLGCLTLGIVEIGRHGDHGAADAPELVLRETTKASQNFAADLDRCDDLSADVETHDVRLTRRRRDERVRAESLRFCVIAAAPHEAL